jgi:phage contractile tail tube protein, P2 family
VAAEINKITNANVYLDGTASLIGRAGELTLPELSVATTEHKALGMFGTLELPAGLEAMTCEVKWTGFYADHLRAAANPFASHKLQVRGSLETWTAEGRTREVPVVWLMTATWKVAKLGVLKPQENGEFDDELSVSQVKVTHDGAPVCEIDVFNNIWIVNGVDVLARWRLNIGA